MSDHERQGVCLVSTFALAARSLDIPTTDHPNKMPFSGILTYLDEPSDAPPGGSPGGCVMITSAAATEEVLDSLLGMAVDYTPSLDDHNPQLKIGVITGSEVVEPEKGRKAIIVKGFIYAADFPEAAKEIKARKNELGMSFEARNLWTTDPKANPIPIHDLVFTGAAILLKDKAAYKTTSISAAATVATLSNEDFIMDENTKKELTEMLAAALKPVADAVASQNAKIADLEKLPTKIAEAQAANHLDKIEPHAKRLEDAASKMDEAGIGGDANNGHAVVLRKMAGAMRADAAQGKLPHVFYHFNASAAETEKKVDVESAVNAAVAKAAEGFNAKIAEVKAAAEKTEKELGDKLAAAETKLSDIKAKDARDAAAPERKTLDRANGALLAKTGLEPGADGKLDMTKLNAVMASHKDIFRNPEDGIAFKTALHNAGLID